MHPNQPISLKGKDAIAFEKYQKRKGAKEEIEFCKKSDEVYRRWLQRHNKK